jgi:hypothetical protein
MERMDPPPDNRKGPRQWKSPSFSLRSPHARRKAKWRGKDTNTQDAQQETPSFRIIAIATETTLIVSVHINNKVH